MEKPTNRSGAVTSGGRVMDNEDENGGHGYVEHASIGNAIVHVFYADDNEECEADEKQSIYRGE